jgi:hypothetical protein
MGTVIYSASPLQTFFGSFATVVFLILLGVLGIAMAFLRRGQRPLVRWLTAGLGALLLVAACAFALFVLASMSGGSKTLTVQFDNKTIAQDNCGDNGETCARYVLSATTSANAYDFDVPPSAYDRAKLGVCYKITYYPSTGLYSQGSYQRIDNITRIETADPSACQ